MALSHAGYYIYLHHHDSLNATENTLAELPNKGEIIQCDLSEYHAVENMISALAGKEHPLKHIVNNASLFSADELENFTESSFANHMNINLRGPLQLGRGLYKILGDEDRGSVVNVLDSKVFALNADFFSYTLSKFGLYGATEMMAQALSPKVRVNAVAPGLTLISETQTIENFKLASHLNFNGTPIDADDIAKTVMHLIGTPSINGTVIPVDGGQKMMNFTQDIVNVVSGILEKSKK